jgi:hypothetical protein
MFQWQIFTREAAEAGIFAVVALQRRERLVHPVGAHNQLLDRGAGAGVGQQGAVHLHQFEVNQAGAAHRTDFGRRVGAEDGGKAGDSAFGFVLVHQISQIHAGLRADDGRVVGNLDDQVAPRFHFFVGIFQPGQRVHVFRVHKWPVGRRGGAGRLCGRRRHRWREGGGRRFGGGGRGRGGEGGGRCFGGGGCLCGGGTWPNRCVGRKAKHCRNGGVGSRQCDLQAYFFAARHTRQRGHACQRKHQSQE